MRLWRFWRRRGVLGRRVGLRVRRYVEGTEKSGRIGQDLAAGGDCWKKMGIHCP